MKKIIWLLALVVLGVIFIGGCGFIGKFQIAPNSNLYAPRYGNLECKNTGGYSEIEVAMYKCDKADCGGTYSGFVDFGTTADSKYTYVSYNWCPDKFGQFPCKTKIKAACPIFGSLQRRVEVKINDGSWQPVQTEYMILAGQEDKYMVRCNEASITGSWDGGTVRREFSNSPTVWSVEPVLAVYKTDPTGMTKSGKVSGSEPFCSLISTDSETLKALQPINDIKIESIQGIEFLNLGDTKDIVVGWDSTAIIGNIDPLGMYNGKDVYCVAGTGLYEINSVGTYGGSTYYIQGNQVLNFQSSGGCCGTETGECSGGYVCENYKCVQKAVTCTEGQCNQWQKGTTITLDDEQIISNEPYLVTVSCDINSCLHTTKKKVGCTKEYCDNFDTAADDYYCPTDHSACLKVSVKQPCPDGKCCEERNLDYTPGSCISGLQCCKETTYSLIGSCQESCAAPPLNCDDPKNIDVQECQKCVIKESEKIIEGVRPKECCELNGGTWVMKSGLFGATKENYCKMTPTWIIAVIVISVAFLFVLLIAWLIIWAKSR